jgi:hypothetical protein
MSPKWYLPLRLCLYVLSHRCACFANLVVIYLVILIILIETYKLRCYWLVPLDAGLWVQIPLKA